MEDIKAFNTNGLTIKVCITYLVLAIVFLGVLRPSFFEGTIGICFRVMCLVIGMIFIIYHLKFREMINMSMVYVIPVIISCIYNFSGAYIREIFLS